MTHYCGYIALVGRPNTGKSTLINRILQTKLSIISSKPQTTRHRILGIHTEDNHQLIYVDTPGIHKKHSKKIMNQMLNNTAKSVLWDVDIVVMLIDGMLWGEEEQELINYLGGITKPVILVINKIDKINDKRLLLPCINTIQQKYNFAEIIPLSARTGTQVDNLQQILKRLLPSGVHLFPADQFTDRSLRFLCAERLREKIFNLCDQELPYVTNVEIESFKEEVNLVTLHAMIVVEKSSHKQIIIGAKGAKLKEIANRARLDIEQLLGKQVFLRCWCKVKSGWTNDTQLLNKFGYESIL